MVAPLVKIYCSKIKTYKILWLNKSIDNSLLFVGQYAIKCHTYGTILEIYRFTVDVAVRS